MALTSFHLLDGETRAKLLASVRSGKLAVPPTLLSTVAASDAIAAFRRLGAAVDDAQDAVVAMGGIIRLAYLGKKKDRVNACEYRRALKKLRGQSPSRWKNPEPNKYKKQ